MSRLFDDAANEYLAVTSTPVTGVPLTISAWFRTDIHATRQALATVIGVWNHYHILMIDTQVWAETFDGVGQGSAVTTSNATSNEWHHAAGVFYATNSRAAFLNGGSKGTNATASTPTVTDVYLATYGALGLYLSGTLAEAGIWNIALTDNEVRWLAQGHPPWRIRRDHLVGFWLPFADRTDRDFSGRGYHMSPTNTPTWGPDPPKVIRLARLP